MINKSRIKKIIRIVVPRKILQKREECRIYKIESKLNRYSIIHNPVEQFGSYYHIKDVTWEPVYVAPTYKLWEGSKVKYYHEAQDIILLHDVKVRNGSTIVTLSDAKSALWDKAMLDNFSKYTALDQGLYKYDKDTLYVFPAKVEKINGKVISMCGVHATLWPHFLTQYFPKLFYAEDAGLLDDDIVILCPKYNDRNIIEIYNELINRHPKVQIKYAENDIEYQIEEFYWMHMTCHLGDSAFYLATSDCVIPQKVLKLLTERFVNRFKANVKTIKGFEYIYLSRGANQRDIINKEEVEEFFVSKGFKIINPGDFSLEEKANIFHNAKVVVGPYGSAWTNTMFCNGGFGLLLTNMPRAMESYQVSFADIGGLDILQVTGWDVMKDSTHSDYEIPLLKIKEAYDLLIRKG